MIMYRGGTVVEKGIYWSPIDGRRVKVGGEGILPGDADSQFLKVSSMVLLFFAPLFGMMYVFFLPLFGIGVFVISWVVPVICTLASAASTGIRICSRIDGRSVFFNWDPSRSYLSSAGKKRKIKGNARQVADKRPRASMRSTGGEQD